MKVQGAYCWLREIEQEHVEDTGPMSQNVTYCRDQFIGTNVERKLIGDGSIKFASYRYAWPVGDRTKFHNSWYH